MSLIELGIVLPGVYPNEVQHVLAALKPWKLYDAAFRASMT